MIAKPAIVPTNHNGIRAVVADIKFYLFCDVCNAVLIKYVI